MNDQIKQLNTQIQHRMQWGAHTHTDTHELEHYRRGLIELWTTERGSGSVEIQILISLLTFMQFSKLNFLLLQHHMDECMYVFKQAAVRLDRIIDPATATASHHIAQHANTTSQRANTQYNGFSIFLKTQMGKGNERTTFAFSHFSRNELGKCVQPVLLRRVINSG